MSGKTSWRIRVLPKVEKEILVLLLLKKVITRYTIPSREVFSSNSEYQERLLLYSLLNKEFGIIWFSSETHMQLLKPPKISIADGNIRADREASFRMDSLCWLTHHLSQNCSVSICYQAEWNVTQTLQSALK